MCVADLSGGDAVDLQVGVNKGTGSCSDGFCFHNRFFLDLVP